MQFLSFFLTYLAVWAGLYFGPFMGNAAVTNVFQFWTWALVAAGFAMGLVGPVSKSTRLSKWVTNIAVVLTVSALAVFGFFWLAAAFYVASSIMTVRRAYYEQKQREFEEPKAKIEARMRDAMKNAGVSKSSPADSRGPLETGDKFVPEPAPFMFVAEKPGPAN